MTYRLSIVTLLCVLGLLTSGVFAAGNTFYVDPVNGSMNGDGSAARPWRTLQEVFSNNLVESNSSISTPVTLKNPGAPVKAGDTIKLMSGNHGSVVSQCWFNQDYITIEAAAKQTPTLSRFAMIGAQKWILRGLTISPEVSGVFDGKPIVFFESSNDCGPVRDIIVENNTIYSASSIKGWTANDWLSKRAHGIQAYGPKLVFRNNNIRNVDFGIVTGGDDVLAEHNKIQNYSGDGMRGGGDRVTFQYNSIEWSYQIDDNHNDAIQFFRPNEVPHRDCVLRGNFIRSYADPARPLSTGGEGIALFDGPYINFSIENNVVMAAHHHGIALYDGDDCRVVNNTVLDVSRRFDSWILLHGTSNSVARNNLAFLHRSEDSTGCVFDHNILLTPKTLDSIFVDWKDGNLRLKPRSLPVDAGSGDLAPNKDFEGRSRLSGNTSDVGAYEYAVGND